MTGRDGKGLHFTEELTRENGTLALVKIKAFSSLLLDSLVFFPLYVSLRGSIFVLVVTPEGEVPANAASCSPFVCA